MSNLFRNIMTGLVFAAGIIAVMSGEFIISSTLFASTTFASIINANKKKNIC